MVIIAVILSGKAPASKTLVGVTLFGRINQHDGADCESNCVLGGTSGEEVQLTVD